jgi:hypothetical protein
MGYSTYQVQRLMARLKRERRPRSEAESEAAPSAAPLPGTDRVRLSELARAQIGAAAEVLRLPAGTPVSPATIVDDSPLPPAVRSELERRAGSFMRPPLPPPARVPIPRARRLPPEPGRG